MKIKHFDDLLTSNMKSLLAFMGVAIPAFIGIGTIDSIAPVWQNLFLTLSVFSFITALLLANRIYKLFRFTEQNKILEEHKRVLEEQEKVLCIDFKEKIESLDKVTFFKTIGELNEFYTKLNSNIPKNFDQVLTPGNLINTEKDVYVKCISLGGNGTRIILVATLHDYLSAIRSDIHGNAKVIVITGYMQPFPQLTLPSITLADNNLLISFSNVTSNILGRPILLEDINSENSRGVSIEITDKERTNIINSYFQFLERTSSLSKINIDNIDSIKLLFFKNSSHKYILDVITAMSKEIVSICDGVPDENGGYSPYLKYIGIIGSFAINCHNYYKTQQQIEPRDIDLLCIFTNDLTGEKLSRIYEKVEYLAKQCSIDSEIVFTVEKKIAPIKCAPQEPHERIIHLICVPEACLKNGSVFSQYDRMINHFDIWPYKNDNESVVTELYNIQETDLTINHLKADKLGPLTLLNAIKNKRIDTYVYNAEKNELEESSPCTINNEDLECFSQYAVKWSLINYLRCYNKMFSYCDFIRLTSEFKKLSSSFSYDLSKYDYSINESLILLECLLDHIDQRIQPNTA